MKRLMLLVAAIAALQLTGSAWAGGYSGGDRHHACSLKSLAGRWAFATDVGHETIAFGGDITAIGTFDLGRDGEVAGTFDVTFENNAFIPDVPFEGSMTVEENCKGTLTFVTGQGTSRTDSLIVIDRDFLWGMSQDPQNLWTYRVRRLSRGSGH